MTQSKTKAILLLSLIFLFGTVVGAALGITYLYKINPPIPPKGTQQTDNRFQRREKFVNKLNDRLKLSPDQFQKLKNIIDETDRKHEALDQPLREQHNALTKEMFNQIRALLTDAQKKEFDAMLQGPAHRDGKDATGHKEPPGMKDPLGHKGHKNEPSGKDSANPKDTTSGKS